MFKIKSLINKLVFIIFLFSSFLLTNFSVNSQQEKGIIVSPIILELDPANRGNSYEFSIKVDNDSNEDVEIETNLQEFTASNEEGIPIVKDLEENSELKNWIEIKNSKFTLNKKEKIDSKLVANIPLNAEPGGYYLAVTYSINQKSNSVDNNILIKQNISALVFINIPGEVKKEVKFETFSLNKQVYDPFFDDISLLYKIVVDGKTFVRPSGNLFIGNDTSKPDNVNLLNPDNKIVLPNSARTFEVVSKADFDWKFLTDSLSSNNEITLSRKFFGNQKITGVIVYTDGNGNLMKKEVETEVFFFPWKMMLLVLSILLLLIVLFFVIRFILKNKNLIIKK